MPAPGLPPILCVDDEPHILEGIKRTLHRHYAVSTAVGPEAALALLETNKSFTVVISDLRMPKMTGAQLLAKARVLCPETVRLLLTGTVDLAAAITAVNEGQIFRFLTKPCAPDTLIKAVETACEQHRLITAERELLELTLKGSLAALADVLAAVSPAVFGRATRIKRLSLGVARAMDLRDPWALEVASLFSQLGYVVVPTATAERVLLGKPITPEEAEMVERVPAMARKILGNIPRLEVVRAILDHYPKAATDPGASESPVAARILRIALDWDALDDGNRSNDDICATLSARKGVYDESVLLALARVVLTRDEPVVVAVKLAELTAGTVAAEDVCTPSGMLLLARGNEISETTLARLRNFRTTVGVKEPILVWVERSSSEQKRAGAA